MVTLFSSIVLGVVAVLLTLRGRQERHEDDAITLDLYR